MEKPTFDELLTEHERALVATALRTAADQYRRYAFETVENDFPSLRAQFAKQEVECKALAVRFEQED
jgi:hypothetical protein